MGVLELFHPLIQTWFKAAYSSPTDIQQKAWPEIAAGKHVLATAPTGSGKTLTAFLWAINRFLSDSGQRVLYISPLRALNNDIQRNLRTPLTELENVFDGNGERFPEISIGVRSGDTPSRERRRMEKMPPDIFITTPESLHILLSSKGGRSQLHGFATVILDEIHALSHTKRGAFLMSSIERLTDYSGEFQRIALSATVTPLPLIAEFVGGYRQVGGCGKHQYEARPVHIIDTEAHKLYQLSIDTPETEEDDFDRDWWQKLSRHYLGIINNYRSTLFFANSRRMVEKLSRFINEEAGERIVYAHHGSLAREIRYEVEQKLKSGELAGIIATGSLELGIDVGSVDAVVLVQTPFSVAQTVQRIGRSGHQVGETSTGLFIPIHSRDLLYAAAGVKAVLTGEIEECRPVVNPLDVLAQLILSMALYDEQDVDEIFSSVKRCWSYHTLRRKEFDLVVEMLAGRYADSRIRELQPRLLFDKVRGTIKGKDNSALLIFLSGGVIPDRGYYTLRAADSKARLGDLDEEFVWERSEGDCFPFGNKIWKIHRITHNDVEVVPAERSNAVIPFWRADEQNRPYHFSKRIINFLDDAEKNIDGPAFPERLQQDFFFTTSAAKRLLHVLRRQIEATGSLPGPYKIIAEHFNDPLNTSDSRQTVVHTFWGGSINRPYAFALSAVWEERFGYTLQVFANNDCILLNLPHDFSMDELIQLITPEDIPRLLRKQLESTGYFGAKFRENAQRSLLLPRKTYRERMPLWLNRLRSKKLLEAISDKEDFPVVLETWRECLQRDFDLDNLALLLDALQTGEITIIEALTTSPSPFAEEIIWRQTNYYMYQDDTPTSSLRTSLSDELIQGLLESPQLVPEIPDELIKKLTAKLQRTAPGYLPNTPEDVLQLLRERLLIPRDEWEQLMESIAVETAPVEDRIATLPEADNAIVAVEYAAKLRQLFTPGAQDVQPEWRNITNEGDKQTSKQAEAFTMARFLSQWMQFYGPVSPEFPLEKLTGEDVVKEYVRERIAQGVRECLEDQVLVKGQFRPSTRNTEGVDICERKNLEILLRMRRARERPEIETRPIQVLPFFLAQFQGLTRRELGGFGGDMDRDTDRSWFHKILEQVFGFPAPVHLWEADILPARLSSYYTEMLDSVFLEYNLLWFGCGKEKVSFCFSEDSELFLGPGYQDHIGKPEDGGYTHYTHADAAAAILSTLEHAPGKLDFHSIARTTECDRDQITQSLWELAWNGLITNDSFSALRRGAEYGFKQGKQPAGEKRSRRGRISRSTGNRWVKTLPLSGNWQLRDVPAPSPDPLYDEELTKDRVRQVLARYGILFRELLQPELPDLSWSSLFRTLRLMELSGEITTGRFFEDIPGLQFCSPEGLRLLEQLPTGSQQEPPAEPAADKEQPVYWLNAADPASLCGRGIEAFKGKLPPRIPSTHLMYRGDQLIMVSKRLGEELDFRVAPDENGVLECGKLFHHLVTRPVNPVTSIKTETINGKRVTESPYTERLTRIGFTRDYNYLRFHKRYHSQV